MKPNRKSRREHLQPKPPGAKTLRARRRSAKGAPPNIAKKMAHQARKDARNKPPYQSMPSKSVLRNLMYLEDHGLPQWMPHGLPQVMQRIKNCVQPS